MMGAYVRVRKVGSPDGQQKQTASKQRTEHEYLKNEIYPRRVTETGRMRSIYL